VASSYAGQGGGVSRRVCRVILERNYYAQEATMPGAAAIVFMHKQTWIEKIGTLIRQFSESLVSQAGVPALLSQSLIRQTGVPMQSNQMMRSSSK